jgi:hypothetical protein
LKKRLVIRQQLVEARPDVLDEPALHEQRFPLALALDDVEVLDEVKQGLLFGAELRRGDKVRADAVPKRPCLAHVEHRPRPVLHEVDARQPRQLPGLFREALEALVASGLRAAAAHGVGRF